MFVPGRESAGEYGASARPPPREYGAESRGEYGREDPYASRDRYGAPPRDPMAREPSSREPPPAREPASREPHGEPRGYVIKQQSWNFQIFPEVQNCPSQVDLLLQVEVPFSGGPMTQHINLILGTQN